MEDNSDIKNDKDIRLTVGHSFTPDSPPRSNVPEEPDIETGINKTDEM